MSKTIYAAGCVVYRVGLDSEVELLVAHRPRYDDWSFPKGKRDKGETDLECALREVEEETSVRGSIGAELEPVRYVDHKQRPKVVRYWAMEIAADSPPFVVNEEVDEIRWLSAAASREILTYDHDQGLIDQLLTALA